MKRRAFLSTLAGAAAATVAPIQSPTPGAIVTDGFSGTRLRIGDTFTVPGFYVVNPATREQTENLKVFRITGVCMSTGRVDLSPYLPAFTSELPIR
jgi:hypothetical protein